MEQTNEAVQRSAVISGERVEGMTIVSGIQPSGAGLHLGNYYGAMEQHISCQNDNRCMYFIANYHALTTSRDPQQLRHASLDVALDYLALGLDPGKVALYRQSDVPEVTELAWILGCHAGMGELERAVSFKDKVSRGLTSNVGLFAYPVLMAADILIMRADVVPVGQDQLQHIEFTRDWAQRFNRAVGRDIFTIPRAKLNNARIVPGLDGQKMSKSYGNTIPLFAEPQVARKLLMSVTTDSAALDAPKDPSRCHAFALLRLMASPDETADWERRYRAGGMGYGQVKQRLVELYEERFGASRALRREFAANPERVEAILHDGARHAREIAGALLVEVRDAVGLSRSPRCSA